MLQDIALHPCSNLYLGESGRTLSNHKIDDMLGSEHLRIGSVRDFNPEVLFK